MSILLALWTFATSPFGRIVSVGLIALSFGFYQGYALKARFDRSATLSTIVDKQRIDLEAAKQKEADDAETLTTLTKANDANQERIRVFSHNPGACIADDAAARRLRSIR